MIIKSSDIYDFTSKSLTIMNNEFEYLSKILKTVKKDENAMYKTYAQLSNESKRLRAEYRNIYEHAWDGKVTLVRGTESKHLVKCEYCGSNKTHLERCDSCGANIDK